MRQITNSRGIRAKLMSARVGISLEICAAEQYTSIEWNEGISSSLHLSAPHYLCIWSQLEPVVQTLARTQFEPWFATFDLMFEFPNSNLLLLLFVRILFCSSLVLRSSINFFRAGSSEYYYYLITWRSSCSAFGSQMAERNARHRNLAAAYLRRGIWTKYSAFIPCLDILIVLFLL